MKVIDISRRLQKLEAKRSTSPLGHLGRHGLEEMLAGHIAALVSEYGADWETIYRTELSGRCPETLATWDNVRARQSARSTPKGLAEMDIHHAK